MPWTLLLLAGALEVCWMITMKYSAGFSRLWWSLATIAIMTVSFLMVSVSLKTIPVGTAYAVWTGIGAVGAALVGLLWFKEPATAMRLVSMAAIIGGIIGLKLTAAH